MECNVASNTVMVQKKDIKAAVNVKTATAPSQATLEHSGCVSVNSISGHVFNHQKLEVVEFVQNARYL